MSQRMGRALAAGAAVLAYGALYLCGWWFVWQVPAVDRDGMEWGLLFLLTLPWSLLAGSAAGWFAVHAGAVINVCVIATFVALKPSRRPRTRAGETEPGSQTARSTAARTFRP